jgi:hypothetical protein
MARRPARALDWEGLFRQWRSSGLTQEEFCRRHGLSIHSFRGKLYRPDANRAAVDARRPVGERPRDFLPVRVVGEARSSPEWATRLEPGRPVEILLGCGRRIAVPPGFDAGTLLQVLAVLQSNRC